MEDTKTRIFERRWMFESLKNDRYLQDRKTMDYGYLDAGKVENDGSLKDQKTMDIWMTERRWRFGRIDIEG